MPWIRAVGMLLIVAGMVLTGLAATAVLGEAGSGGEKVVAMSLPLLVPGVGAVVVALTEPPRP